MIAGIDFSTKAVDVVLLDEDSDTVEWHRFPLDGPGDAFDRSRLVRAAMPSRSWWEDHGVIAVGIEDPRGYSAGHLYRIQGGILQCLPADVLVQPWIPSVWRRLVGLAGNADKNAIAIHSRRLLGGVTPGGEWPQDAHCIARATRSSVEHGEAAA